MNFTTTVDEFFCEGKINGVPEYFNSISSLFISLISFGGLQTKVLHEDVKSIYFILFINGFFSFMFHWTMYYGWKMFDQFTMIFAIWFGLKRCISITKFKNDICLFCLNLVNTVILVLSACEFDKFFRKAFTIDTLLFIYFYYYFTMNFCI